VNKTQRLVLKLVCLVILMFGFSFALVPLYTVFCKVTGLNGKVELDGPSSYAQSQFNKPNKDHLDLEVDRRIIVEFDVNRNEKIPCEIVPKHAVLQVNPGVLCSTSYSVKNLTGKRMVIQAIPSISPGIVAKYLKKLECFCFTPQELKPYESQQFALRFWLEPEIPDNVYRLTLSYTLFDVTKTVTKEKEKESGT
jgi:cytochrome c oxidase assembly protein subunit 11